MSLAQLGVLIVVVIGVSILLHWISNRPRDVDIRLGLVGLVLVATSLEFWTISRLVTFTHMLESPPLKALEQSPVRAELLKAAKTRPTLRLFAPGANLPSTLGVSSAPIYLTFGPAEYVDDSLRRPEDWIHRGGVTHLLSFEKPANATEMKLLWKGDDPFLNRAWGRGGQPLYLYELEESLGRLQLQSNDGEVRETGSWKMTSFDSRANSVECAVELNEPGVLVLMDLDYPGWSVTVDGHAAESVRIDNLFRGVRLERGSHRVVWSYRPSSLVSGVLLSLATLLFLAGVAHIRFWHPKRLRWLDESVASRNVLPR